MSWYPKTQKPCRDCGRPFVGGPPARYGPCCRWRHRGRKSKKYVWTPEKDEVLRRRYDSRPGVPASIAASFGWPRWQIKKRAAALGLTRSTTLNEPRRWTAEEVRFLEANAGVRLTAYIAKRLGRSLTSVVVKLKRLSMSRRIREGYTLRDLEECFGVDHHTIDRWIRRELLIGRRRHGDSSPAYERDAWQFTDDDLLRFIRKNPNAFDLRRVDQTWFMDLVLGAARRQISAKEPAA